MVKMEIREYKKMIILSYFYAKEKKYDLEELLRLLGFTFSERNDFLSSLLEEKRIAYSKNFLLITEKGIKELKNNKMDKFYLEEKNYCLRLSNSRTKIGGLYTPRTFLSKS